MNKAKEQHVVILLFFNESEQQTGITLKWKMREDYSLSLSTQKYYNIRLSTTVPP